MSMSHFKFNRQLSFLTVLLCIFAAPHYSSAATKTNPNPIQTAKEHFALIPLHVGEETQALNGAMETTTGGFAEIANTRIAKFEVDPAYKVESNNPAMARIPGRNYEMGKYLITRGEFAKFVTDTDYDAGNKCWVFDGSWNEKIGYNWRNPGFNQDDTHPVTCVNWDDAQAYISWLSKKTGRQYRLPTETEWEYACHGGSPAEYCGSNDINAVAWYKDNSNSTTHPVGQKQANGYGLYDMSGNVWEWMQDWSDNSQMLRSLRGGSWGSPPLYVRAPYHNYDEPAARGSSIGFRLAKTLP